MIFLHFLKFGPERLIFASTSAGRKVASFGPVELEHVHACFVAEDWALD